MRMAAFGKKEKFFPPSCNGVADQFLTPVITFSRINNVDAGIECGVQKSGGGFGRYIFKPNLRSAEAQNGNIHVRLAEPSFFHRLLINRGFRVFKRIYVVEALVPSTCP